MLSAGGGRRRGLLTCKHRANASTCRGTFSTVQRVIDGHQSTMCRRRTVCRIYGLKARFCGVPSASGILRTLRGKCGMPRTAGRVGPLSRTLDALVGRTSGFFGGSCGPRVSHGISGTLLGACTRLVPTRRHVDVFGMVSGRFGKGVSTFISTYFSASVFQDHRTFSGFITGPSTGALRGSLVIRCTGSMSRNCTSASTTVGTRASTCGLTRGA